MIIQLLASVARIFNSNQQRGPLFIFIPNSFFCKDLDIKIALIFAFYTFFCYSGDITGGNEEIILGEIK